jgi:hypothetical protein
LPLVKFENNLIDEDPRFVVAPPADFRLRDDSPALRLGFQQIPFKEIGLYASPERASWPVHTVLRQDPVPPPPAATKFVRPRVVGAVPVFDVPRLAGPVTMDGKLTAEEWFGLDPAKGVIVQQGVEGEKVAFPSKAWLAWDDQALYIAFDNAVNKDIPMGRDDAWGANDAVEVAWSNPALAAKAPILVLRGFTSGKFDSSAEAGAPTEMVRQAGENVQCAATVIDAGRWTVEMRIPFASLGLDPNAGLKVPFNLAVRKQGDDPWVMWRGTGNCTWYVPEAGLIRFVR